MTTHLLSYAYRDAYDVAVVLTGDADYLPAIEDVKRTGRRVFVGAFSNGLAPSIRLAADVFWDLDREFISALQNEKSSARWP